MDRYCLRHKLILVAIKYKFITSDIYDNFIKLISCKLLQPNRIFLRAHKQKTGKMYKNMVYTNLFLHYAAEPERPHSLVVIIGDG